MEYPKPISATDPPPPGTYVLAFTPDRGWWQAQYFPDDADPEDAWAFVGIEPFLMRGPVTHWMPMPPDPT